MRSILLKTIRVPASIRRVVIDCGLARNDITILLLILERTLDNVLPPVEEATLSIRHIAQENGCSNKSAENSVNKLKELGLVIHEVFPGTKRPGTLRINPEVFGRSANIFAKAPQFRAEPIDSAALEREALEKEIEAIRHLLQDRINSGKHRESELPDRYLAGQLLDYFESSEAVEKWVDGLHNAWKASRFNAKGYGIYSSSLQQVRDAKVASRVRRMLDSVPVFESMPISLPAPRKHFTKIKTKNWTIQAETSVEEDYDNHEESEHATLGFS
jgi:hypothetical protein